MTAIFLLSLPEPLILLLSGAALVVIPVVGRKLFKRATETIEKLHESIVE